MGKRSSFKRLDKDRYLTWDPRAVAPLLPHLKPGTRFVEPCAGAGDLIRQLEAAGHVCAYASDIDPLAPGIEMRDALAPGWSARACMAWADMTITNPPWARELLHAMIVQFSDIGRTWLLFDAGWAFSQQAAPFRDRLCRIVPVGRVKWIRGTKDDPKDDCAWYLFDRPQPGRVAAFHLREGRS